MSFGINNIAILSICGADFCCMIIGISKNEAINLLKNTDLSEVQVQCWFNRKTACLCPSYVFLEFASGLFIKP